MLTAITKVCGACKVEKPLSDFHVRRDAPNATHRSICKSCSYERSRSYPGIRELQDAWRDRNKPRVNELARNRRQKNPSAFKAAQDKWRNKNSHVHAERVRRREALKRKATPKWADRSAIIQIYEKAKRLTDESGIRYQVDHIIPLVSSIVCGLHVENNLQILTINENSQKRNIFRIESC